MEILNETVYDSQDIRILCYEIASRCEVRQAETKQVMKERFELGEVRRFNPDHYWWQPSPLPEQLRVGYYKRSSTRGPERFCSIRWRNSVAPRLGIAPIEELDLPAMLVVAGAASDIGIEIPTRVLRAVILQIASIFRGSLKNDDVGEFARLYSLRVCSREGGVTTAQQVKQARHRAKVTSTERKIAIIDDDVSRLERQIVELKVKRVDLEEKLQKLQPKQEVARV
jgi:hypothetical protein